jgi:hypothetical protein
MESTSILISHAANERPLAEAWKDLICGTFSGIDQASVFFSNELGAFSGQETFVAQIFSKMREATSILSLQTPSSSGRPWIIFEGGMAWADKGKSLYPIIFESRDVEKNESIFGKLQNPMNALQQYRGDDPDQVLTLLGLIQKDFFRGFIKDKPNPAMPMIDPRHLSRALKQYEEKIIEQEHCWGFRQKRFDKQIELHFSHKDKETLSRLGQISDRVRVEGESNSLLIFGLAKGGDWKAFQEHLENMQLPWPGSAARWARSLRLSSDGGR